MTKKQNIIPAIIAEKTMRGIPDGLKMADALRGYNLRGAPSDMEAIGGEEPAFVDTPPRNTIDAWLQELAKLSPEAYRKVLDKWDVEGVDEVDDDALREFAISVRTALDAVREVLKAARAKADLRPAR